MPIRMRSGTPKQSSACLSLLTNSVPSQNNLVDDVVTPVASTANGSAHQALRSLTHTHIPGESATDSDPVTVDSILLDDHISPSSVQRFHEAVFVARKPLRAIPEPPRTLKVTNSTHRYSIAESTASLGPQISAVQHQSNDRQETGQLRVVNRESAISGVDLGHGIWNHVSVSEMLMGLTTDVNEEVIREQRNQCRLEMIARDDAEGSQECAGTGGVWGVVKEIFQGAKNLCSLDFLGLKVAEVAEPRLIRLADKTRKKVAAGRGQGYE